MNKIAYELFKVWVFVQGRSASGFQGLGALGSVLREVPRILFEIVQGCSGLGCYIALITAARGSPQILFKIVQDLEQNCSRIV